MANLTLKKREIPQKEAVKRKKKSLALLNEKGGIWGRGELKTGQHWRGGQRSGKRGKRLILLLGKKTLWYRTARVRDTTRQVLRSKKNRRASRNTNIK